MRLIVDLRRVEGDRVVGAVTAADGVREPFSGFLELLRLLEQALHEDSRSDTSALRPQR